MKAILTLALAVILCPLALTVFSADASDEVVEERRVELKLKADDGDLVELDLSDLEIGDTTQFTTDSGKLVTATRDDQGYLIDIDGKEIRVASPEHHGHDGEGAHRVMVKVLQDEDGEDGEHEVRVEKRVIVSADGEAIVSHGDGGEHVKVIRIGGPGDGEGHGEHGVKVITDIDCEDGDEEECIDRLLREHGIDIQIDGLDGDIDADGDGVEVIVIHMLS